MSWPRKILPRSLRSRLILSFGILIFLSLFLAGSATFFLLRDQQQTAARERVGLLTDEVILRAFVLEASGLSAEAIQATLEEEYNVRILLVSGNRVVGDSGKTLLGETIAALSQQGVPARPLSDLRYRIHRVSRGPENLLLFLSPQGSVFATIPGIRNVFVPEYQAVIAVDESDLNQAWRDLLPRLFLAGGVAFLASVVAAGLLARSITRPLHQITVASEEMTRGHYDQQISAHGGEEVTRLARAFNEMAREVSNSNRTLRDFLANVSHELKTPLTSIQGFSQAMTDGSVQEQEDLIEAARIINDEAVRMRSLVDDLLYLSQVDSGEVTLEGDQIDPNELLTATEEHFRRRAEQGGVEVSVQTVTVPQIEADGRRLEQALANVVDNALRYTASGGRITLRSSVSAGRVQLAVHNNGPAIPPEAMPQIFERFFQVDSNQARAEGNTGLGLAITKEIVEAHGGTVGVTSTVEQGTQFLVDLPLEHPGIRGGG